jgi:ABC-type phosphate transport system ATPase subunit
MYQDITQLHEEVLEFLLEKRQEIPDLRFTIRDDNTFFLSRKRDYLYFSLWNCLNFNITFYDRLFIAIRISKNGDLSLALQKDKTALLDRFMDDIIDKIGKEEFVQENPVIYVKKYGNWRDALNIFLTTHKKMIDEYLTELLKFFKTEKFENKIGFISERFEKDLPNLIKQIEKYKQDKLNSQTYLPANEDIRLSYVNLTNIGHFENISLDLSKQVTVLIGENGSGKSTVLRAIALGITGTDFFDLDKDLQREKSEIFNGFLRINDYKKGVPNYSQEGNIILSVNDKDLTLNLTTSKLRTTIVEIEELKTNRETILHEGKFLKTLVLGFSQSEVKGNKNFSVKEETKPSVLDLFPLISNAGKDGMNDLIEWIYYYVHDRENTEPVDKLFAIFSKIVADNSDNEAVTLKRPYKTEGVIGSPSGKKEIIVCTPDMPDGINLSLVSQGYKNIFRWVSGILMKVYNYQQNFFPEKTLAEISGIVLIDEIDTYLHPKWQRNILKVLVEEFPKLQFVVTTHSMAVISSLQDKNDYLVYKAVKFNNDIFFSEINPLELNPYGADFNEIAEEFMEISYREPIIQTELDNLASLIAEKNIEKATEIVNKLNKLINPNNAEFMKLKSRLEAKKLLVK